MLDDGKEANIHAENNSIAVGGISIGGDVSGNIHIGHTTGSTQKEVPVILEQISSTFQPKPFDGRCAYKGLDHFKRKVILGAAGLIHTLKQGAIKNSER